MSVLPPKAAIGQPRCRLRFVIVCYGGAKLPGKHLASKVHCVDDEIIERLKRRERRRRGDTDECRETREVQERHRQPARSLKPPAGTFQRLPVRPTIDPCRFPITTIGAASRQASAPAT